MINLTSERKMKDAILGKALLNEIAERNPEFAQTISNYFYYEICNSLFSMIKENNPDLNEKEDEAIEEVVMATRNFMKEFIEIFEKYVYND